MYNTPDKDSKAIGELSRMIAGRILAVIHDDESFDSPVFGFRILTDKGEIRDIFFLQDFEGNGPGAWTIQKAK